MTVWNILKRFKFGQLWKLFWLAVKYPLFIYPTLKATAKSFRLAKKEFPKTHGKKGKANAFRHAFWNSYICFQCSKWNKNTSRIIVWTNKITAKHEELSPNEPIDTAMDLHNNKIGRDLFLKSEFKNINEIVTVIKREFGTAKQIKSVEDIAQYPNQLVYITEL